MRYILSLRNSLIAFLIAFLTAFLTALLFLSNSVFAQDLPKNVVYVMDDFSGGLSTKHSPFNLKPNQATVLENARLSAEYGSLVKRAELESDGEMSDDEAGTGLHRLYLKDGTKLLIGTHGDEIEKRNETTNAFTTILTLSSGNYRWQFLTWNNVMIGCDGYNQPVKFDGTSDSATYLGSCLATDAGSGAGPDGVYTYKVSYYTASYEVLFNQASNSITVDDNDIDLTMIPIAPDSYGGEDVVGRRIYRTSDGGSDYKLLSNGQIANNTATTLTDSDTDAARGVAMPAGDATYTPPKGRLCLIHKNRLWFANDPDYPSRIYYSEDGLPDTFLSNSYFNIRPDDGDEITFAKNLLGLLTISKNNSIQKLNTRGDTPSSDWYITDPFSFVGCQAIYSAKNTPIGIIYLSGNGLYRFDGQYSSLLSDPVTPEIEDISEVNYSTCWGEYHNNRYYLSYTSKATGASDNDRVLIYDLVNNAFSTDLMTINAFCVFDSGTDSNVLYAVSSADGTIFAYRETLEEILHRKHSDFTGTFDDARYVPVKWGGDADNTEIELGWTETIDELSKTINTACGDVNRPDEAGSYVSQILYTEGASSLVKLYWNETLPSGGGDVTFQVKAHDSLESLCPLAWSAEFTDPSGSDISAVSAGDYLQYKINLSVVDLDYTPTVYSIGGYTVRLTYRKEGTVYESTVPLQYESGWFDLGYSGYIKQLKKIYCYYESESDGTLSIEFENLYGETDTFDIDLSENPAMYTEYFTNGMFGGEMFKLNIKESSLNDIKVRKIILVYDVQELI